MDKIFSEIDDDKIRFIEVGDGKDRLALHQYLENNYEKYKSNKLGKSSFKCDYFLSGKAKFEFYLCGYCDKKVRLTKYHYGTMKNNKDESKSGYCSDCDEFVLFEPNYDDWDDYKVIWGNNIVCFGKYFHRYIKKYKSYESDTFDINDFLEGKRVYEIDAPKVERYKNGSIKHLNRREIGPYIEEKLNEKNYTIINQ